MADMSREEAAEVLTELKQRLEISDDDDYCYYSRDIDAYDTALTALREQGWVKTRERVPTEADTGDDGKVLCVTTGVFGNTVILHVFWEIIAEHPDRYPYWMPMPPLPEVEE